MRPASRLRDERGMSLVEVMVTALMMVIGVLGIFSVTTASQDLTSTAETLEAASHVAQKELEAMQSLGWSALAHPAAPASGPSPHSVAGAPPGYQVRPGVSEPVAIDPAAGAVSAAATTWSDGRLSGQVWRYVTWVDDPCCAGTQNYKRLTSVVSVANERGIDEPVVLSTLAARKEGV